MSEDVKATIQQRHDRFRATLAQRRQLIAERWTELRMIRWTRYGIEQLRGWVRELADHSAEFGYPALGEVARELQNQVTSIIGDYPPFKELLGGVTASLERMNLQIDRILTASAGSTPNAPTEANAAEPAAPTLLLAIDDPDSTALISAVAHRLGLTPVVNNDVEALRQLPGKSPPSFLLISEAVLQRLDASSSRTTVSSRFGELPWLLLAPHPHIELRYRALSQGAVACLSEPVDIDELAITLQLATLPLTQAPLNVQIVADTPDLAERHAQVLREAGMTPLLGAELANLPDVLTSQAAQVLLLDLNLDTRKRDLWLDLMADTPGFDCLPIVCLNVQRDRPEVRHRRTLFLASPAPRKALPLALRRAVLENDRDNLRVARVARLREHDRTCTPEVFFSRLASAAAGAQQGDARHALLALQIDQPVEAMKEPGLAGLSQAQLQLEAALIDALGTSGCCTPAGSIGLWAIIEGSTDTEFQAFLERLRLGLADRKEGLAASAALLPLRNQTLLAQDALDHVEDQLRQLRKHGGNRLGLASSTAAPAKATAPATRSSPLPTKRMRLQVTPLNDLDGNPQPLHDASIHLSEVDGLEPPLSSLLSEVVTKGLATQLDLWEMHAAVEHLRALPEGARGIEIAMRLSTASRESTMLVPVVRNALAALPEDRGFRLVFEVQESWLVDHNAVAVEMVEGLRSLGCGVMLGDFGGTDNPRSVAWASWFDYARISNRRHEHLAGRGDTRSAAEKLIRTATSRGARIIAGRVPDKVLRGQLGEWGVTLFE